MKPEGRVNVELPKQKLTESRLTAEHAKSQQQRKEAEVSKSAKRNKHSNKDLPRSAE
jgi:hypothetical protein